MLYLIYGTNVRKRELARKNIEKSLTRKNIEKTLLLEVPTVDINNYTILENYFTSTSLFGDKVLVKVESLLDKQESREYVYKHLGDLVRSENVFILDEYFALNASIQKVLRDLQKLPRNGYEVFEANETIKKKDIDPFPFCDLVARRDKKHAWQEFIRIYLEWGESEDMALHGALWWKWKTMWSTSLDETNNFKSSSKYSREELERFGGQIAFMAMRKTAGEINLMREIEKLVLSL